MIPKVQEMIDLAHRDIKRLREARSCGRARLAWTAFLEHSNRAINRLEGHARRTKQIPKYEKLIKTDVWSNRLSAYMRAARNAHEHGVQETEVPDPHNERLAFPNGTVTASVSVIGVTDTGAEVIMPPSTPLEISGDPRVRKIVLKPTVRMAPIDAGKFGTLMPPHVQIASEDEPEAVAAARLYLVWVIDKVATFT
jgi:hypothetical protein